MKGNLKRTTGNSLSPLVTQNKDIGAAWQTLLTEVKLRLHVMQAIRWCDSGVSCVCLSVVRVHLQGLEGDSMAFV